MDVKKEIITIIDIEIKHFTDERDKLPNIKKTLSDRHKILGAIDALEHLKIRVKALNVEDYQTIQIVEENFQTTKKPKSYLRHILFQIEWARDRKRMEFNPGSGWNPDAMQGRKEACGRIEEFVRELDVLLKKMERSEP